jgi:hypothetical protein
MTNQPRSSAVVPYLTAAATVVGLAAIVVFLGVGQTPGAAAPSSLPPVAAGVGASPGASLIASPSVASAAPSVLPAPSAKPTPTPAPASGTWSKPATVAGFDTCFAVVAAIDDHGAQHLAAPCGDSGYEIRYAVSTDGHTWTTSVLKPPTGRSELDPQLAFSGDTLYLAYSRVAPEDGGCGDDGLADVGVYYRTRTLPSGHWSEPTRIGEIADHLQSFRVSGSVIHATVTDEKEGRTFYETLKGATLARYAIADAAGSSSLRVGDDGKGRVAYESTKGIAYGGVSGGQFSSVTVPNSTNGWNPVLTLAPGNDAYLLWNRSDHGAGCAGGGPDPADGTYFATNTSGKWVTTRLTTLVGGASLALDPATGEVHALVTGPDRLVYFHRAADGEWTHANVVRQSAASGVIREDPTTGALFVAYVSYPIEGPSSIEVIGRG